MQPVVLYMFILPLSKHLKRHTVFVDPARYCVSFVVNSWSFCSFAMFILWPVCGIDPHNCEVSSKHVEDLRFSRVPVLVRELGALVDPEND